MTKLVIANWKMNLTATQAREYCSKLAHLNSHIENLIIAPPALYLSELGASFPNLKFAAQDISALEANFGPYTGEISAKMLKNCAANYAIIGHSERRVNFEETCEAVQAKAINCLNNEITPIICIGETFEARVSLQAKEFLTAQLASIPSTDKPIIVAYEPRWAIGTGKIPTQAEVSDIIHFLTSTISKVAKNFKLVYGGSVTSANCREFSQINNLSGLLIGGAALIYSELEKIIEIYA